MKRKILRNKKGFTLIELIATVAMMAILVGVATPSIYYSTEKRQKNAAELDAQVVYRNCIAAVTALYDQYVTPTKPYRAGVYSMISGEELKKATNNKVNNSQNYYYLEDGKTVATWVRTKNAANCWYPEYSRLIVKRLYNVITALDIDIYYYNPLLYNYSDAKNNEPGLIKPYNCSAAERSTFITAGNKNPYIVVQVMSDSTNTNIYVVVSYHNDKCPFTVKNTNVAYMPQYGMDESENKNNLNAYSNNSDNPIFFTYKIRQ